MNHIEQYEYALERNDYAEAARIALSNAKRKSSRSGRSYWLGEVKTCLIKLGIEPVEFMDKIRFADKYRNFSLIEKFLKGL